MKDRTRKVIARDRREAQLKSIILILTLITLTCIVFLLLSVRSAEAQKQEEARYKYFTSVVVDPGDSLWSIAEEHMTDEYASIYDYVSEIAEINHLKGDYLTSGQTLCIPYYCSEYKE